jgi:hypothetical protein
MAITPQSLRITGLVGELALVRYFETRFIVGDRTTAEFLQNRNNWKITNAIIDAGAEGITSGELSERLNTNYKVVTEVTKQLAHMRWITSEPVERPEPKRGRPPTGAPARKFRKPPYLHVWNELDSFEFALDEEFVEHCEKLFDSHVNEFGQFVAAIDEIIAQTKSSERFYPKEPIHICGWSHEGHEFVRALLQAFTVWLNSNTQFQDVLKKYRIAVKAGFEN